MTGFGRFHNHQQVKVAVGIGPTSGIRAEKNYLLGVEMFHNGGHHLTYGCVRQDAVLPFLFQGYGVH